jgi:hypothetical protein
MRAKSKQAQASTVQAKDKAPPTEEKQEKAELIMPVKSKKLDFAKKVKPDVSKYSDFKKLAKGKTGNGISC